MELNRSNEKNEEYRQYLTLLHLGNGPTNIDDLTPIDFSDDECQPIEKNFCLDDHTERKFIFLYDKPALPPDDDDDDDEDRQNHLAMYSHLEHEIE